MRTAFLLPVFIFFFCTGSLQNHQSGQQNPDTLSENSSTLPSEEIGHSENSSTNASSKPLQARPHYLPPSEWPGHLFYVLPKQKLLSSFGYELYSCHHALCDSHPVESFWELPNRRIRHKSISGDSLYTETAEPLNDEWMITFIHTPTGRRIYGTTRKMAIEGIVLLEDLELARNRWLDKTVYSKQGVIATFSNGSRSAISSLRVNIQDPLKVIDVRWGLTPLPVKPIWIVVEHSSGKQGFIPVRYNWTNTMSNAIVNQAPWNDDIFEKNPQTLFDWDENTWELINNHRVILEMTKDQVRLSWGTPVSVSETGKENLQEIWFYASHELTFSGNKLAKITQRPEPNP
jgi:hypothetical protein